MPSEPRGPSPLYLMAIETFMTPGDSSNMIKREQPIRSRPHPTGGKLRTRTPAFAGDASHPSSAEDVGVYQVRVRIGPRLVMSCDEMMMLMMMRLGLVVSHCSELNKRYLGISIAW